MLEFFEISYIHNNWFFHAFCQESLNSPLNSTHSIDVPILYKGYIMKSHSMINPSTGFHRQLIEISPSRDRLARIENNRSCTFNGFHILRSQGRNARQSAQKIQNNPLYAQKRQHISLQCRHHHTLLHFIAIEQKRLHHNIRINSMNDFFQELYTANNTVLLGNDHSFFRNTFLKQSFRGDINITVFPKRQIQQSL